VKLNMNKYNCTFPAMIDDWRKKFHASSDTDDLFPFGFVQVRNTNPLTFSAYLQNQKEWAFNKSK